MKICADCFADSEIQNIVNSIDNSDTCDVLHTHSAHVYDTDKHTDLVPYFEALISIYTPAKSSKYQGKVSDFLPIRQELQDRWHMFSSCCDEKIIDAIIKNICKDKYEDSPELFEEVVGLDEGYDFAYREKHSLLKTHSWDEFKNHLITCNRYHTSHFNTDIFKHFCWVISKKYKAGTKLYRGRISNSLGYSIAEMGHPKPEYSKAGRANAAGVKCLYLASDVETVIREVRAGKGDYITIATFELQKDVWIVDLKRINQISPFALDDTTPLVDYAINKKFLQKINMEMAKIVCKSDTVLDYVPTQYICDFIKTIQRKSSNEDMIHFSGVEYNSTLSKSGYNIAIFEPELFKGINTSLHQVTSLEYQFQKIK